MRFNSNRTIILKLNINICYKNDKYNTICAIKTLLFSQIYDKISDFVNKFLYIYYIRVISFKKLLPSEAAL